MSGLFRHSTWEPEENILDGRLIDIFEQGQRGDPASHKRGPGRKKEKYHVCSKNEYKCNIW